MAGCAECAADLPAGARFCMQCGAPAPQPPSDCTGCGEPVSPGARFCPSCGLATGAAAAESVPAPRAEPPVAERRVTSVLFGDLVGFTPLSEARDAEEVRELLSAYFEECRTVIVAATAGWSRSSSVTP